MCPDEQQVVGVDGRVLDQEQASFQPGCGGLGASINVRTSAGLPYEKIGLRARVGSLPDE